MILPLPALKNLAVVLFLSLPTLLLSTGHTSDREDFGRFNFTVAGQTKVEIPFTLFNNQIVIPLRVNGNVPLNFVLDSGTSQAILFDRHLARDLDVNLGRKIQFAGAGSARMVMGRRSTGVEMELPGGVTGHGMGMVVLNSDYLNMRRYDLHGIIGYQLFIRFALSIDYENKVLILMEPDQYHTKGFHPFDLTIEQSKPYIQTSILLANNSLVPTKLMIDTGAAYGLSLITGMHPAIRPPKSAPKERLAAGLGGEIYGYHGITQVKLSPTLAPEVVTLYVSPEEYTKRGGSLINKAGTLGGDFLKHHLVIIDYIQGKLYLKPQSPAYLTNATGKY